MERQVLAEWRYENGQYKKVRGGPEHPDRMPLVMRSTDMAHPQRELTTSERESLAPPVARRWDSYTGPELEKLAKEHPARFRALFAERTFRREVGGLGCTDEQILSSLRRRGRDDLVAEFHALRKALQ